MPSVIRIHLRPLNCGSSSVDRASAFQAEGRGFEPRLPLKDIKKGFTDGKTFFVYITYLSTKPMGRFRECVTTRCATLGDRDCWHDCRDFSQSPMDDRHK